MTAKSDSEPGDTNFILLQMFGAEYLKAAKVLADDQPNTLQRRHQRPLATLLGHSLELTFKGFLSIATMRAGSPIPFTHDLEELAKYIGSQVSLTNDESEALQVLNRSFARPFRSRYPKLGECLKNLPLSA